MKTAFQKFRDSVWFVVITTIFPVVAVVASVLIYLSAEALRDQAAQHRIEILNLESRVDEKNAQIILLNEQIKQKSTQVEILNSQVELLQKVNTHHETLGLVELQERNKELDEQRKEIDELEGKLAAFSELKTKFGRAEEIASTISSLRAEIAKLSETNKTLSNRLAIHEATYPVLATTQISEGDSETLLNGKLTIGLIDAYGSWGYINVSNLDKVLLERAQIRPGKNIPILVNDTKYVLVINSITEQFVELTLLISEN